MDIAEQKTSKSIAHRLNSYLDVNHLSRMQQKKENHRPAQPTPQMQMQ